MPDDVRQFQAGTLYERLFASKEWERSQTIAVTLSTGFELDTAPIIEPQNRPANKL